jgi:hypothetical protein
MIRAQALAPQRSSKMALDPTPPPSTWLHHGHIYEMSIFMDMIFYNISTYKLQLFYIFWKERCFHFEMLKCLILLNNGYKRCKLKSSIQCNIDFVCVKQLKCWWKYAITTNCICINVFQVPCCNEHFKIFCIQKSTNKMLRSFTL